MIECLTAPVEVPAGKQPDDSVLAGQINFTWPDDPTNAGAVFGQLPLQAGTENACAAYGPLGTSNDSPYASDQAMIKEQGVGQNQYGMSTSHARI